MPNGLWPSDYYIFSFSDLCKGAEKKMFREIILFHYMTYLATPQHRSPCPGVMKSTFLGDPSLAIITIYHAPEVGKKLFKEIHKFYTFTPNFLPCVEGG